MAYSGVLSDLKSYYEIKETISVMSKCVGLNGANLLILLSIKEGYDTYSKLVWALSIDRAMISRSITAMEKDGVIRREVVNKSKEIFLTEEGERLIKEAVKIHRV